eukprot:6322861-Ditylum_brightwellii.AAC.1
MVLSGTGLVHLSEVPISFNNDMGMIELAETRIYYCLEERALSDAAEKGKDESITKEQRFRKFLTKIYTKELYAQELEQISMLQVTRRLDEHRRKIFESEVGDEFEILGYPDILGATARTGTVPEKVEVEDRKMHFAPASILQLCETVT